MAPKLMPNMSLDQQITGTRRAIKSLSLTLQWVPRSRNAAGKLL